MSFISFNFRCTDEECNHLEEGHVCRRSEVGEQFCPVCEAPMKKVFTPTHFPVHSSWSRWQA